MSTGRNYIPLVDVAAACGVSAWELEHKHWPAHWAVPRDFRLLPPRYVCLLAESSIPDLISELRAAGLSEAAERLAAWRVEIAPMESHEEFMARHAANPRGLWFREGQYE